jgi:hypothetical protein
MPHFTHTFKIMGRQIPMNAKILIGTGLSTLGHNAPLGI